MKIIRCDGTSVNTGTSNGCIANLERHLGCPLQWVVCLLHCNELPLRRVFPVIDGNTTSPDSFSGPIGREIGSAVWEWPIANFQPMPLSNFVTLPDDVIEDLSTDQLYAYRFCWAVVLGEANQDLQLMEVGPIVHSRWLTLGCRILRKCVSTSSPSKKLQDLAEFCMKIYFSSWFDIKLNNKISDGSPNFFRMVQQISTFSNQQVREESQKVLLRNSFFGHPENILLAMLCDGDDNVRRIDLNKVRAMRPRHTSKQCNTDEKDMMTEKAESFENGVRKLILPQLNFKAEVYYGLSDLEIEMKI